MSIEQEPLVVINAALPASGPGLIAVMNLPGPCIDRSISALKQTSNPYRAIRVRGVAWVTGNATQLALFLFQGSALTGGVQVMQSMVASASGSQVPLAFDWVDQNPVTVDYVLVGYSTSAVATIVSCIATITGFPS